MVSEWPGLQCTLSFFLFLLEQNFSSSSVERVPWIADGEPCQQAWMCYEPPVSTATGLPIKVQLHLLLVARGRRFAVKIFRNAHCRLTINPSLPPSEGPETCSRASASTRRLAIRQPEQNSGIMWAWISAKLCATAKNNQAPSQVIREWWVLLFSLFFFFFLFYCHGCR